MFEKSKLKKKYPLLSEYISNKVVIRKLLNSFNFNNYYLKNKDVIVEFIDKLDDIYSKEQVINIITDICNDEMWDKIDKYLYNLEQFRTYAAIYSDDLGILKNIEWDTIKNYNSKILYVKAENLVLDMLFEKKYQTSYFIDGEDILKIFRQSDVPVKKRLYTLAKNNNLDFFAFLVNYIHEHKIVINNIDSIFSMEIDDRIYNPIVKEKLGEEQFLMFIKYYFEYSTDNDKKVISKLLECGNYQLLSDLLYLNKRGCYGWIKKEEIENDIFAIKRLSIVEVLAILNRRLSIKKILNYKYFYEFEKCIGNEEIMKKYEDYKKELAFLLNMSIENFSKLGIDGRRELYQKVIAFNDDEKNKFNEFISKINSEMIDYFKQEYADTFNESKNIIDKSFEQVITDSKGVKHNIKIMELCDNQPFNFLITVMHRKARDEFMNMYDRPAHKITIDDPSCFCKDLAGGSEIISTSMINDKFIDTFVGPTADIMYVFGDLQNDDILSICDQDAALSPNLQKETELFHNIDPMSPQELMLKTMMNGSYNEIAIRRKRENGERIMPTAILCYDKINDVSIKHAEYFNIPIIVIKTKTYQFLSNYTRNEEKGVDKKIY